MVEFVFTHIIGEVKMHLINIEGSIRDVTVGASNMLGQLIFPVVFSITKRTRKGPIIKDEFKNKTYLSLVCLRL